MNATEGKWWTRVDGGGREKLPGPDLDLTPNGHVQPCLLPAVQLSRAVFILPAGGGGVSGWH